MAVIIQGIDIPKKHYMNGYYISDDGKVFDVSRKNVVGKAVQIPDGARLIDGEKLRYRVKAECNPYGKPSLDYESGNKILNVIDEAPTIFEEE